MASTSQKKTTKKTSGKSGSRTTAKKPQPRPIRREVGGVVCLVLALCVFVSYFGISAIFIDWLAVLIKGLLGYGYWLFGPALVLADEPTGNLDQATGAQIMALMFRLNREQGTTLVLVTHDPIMAARCGRQLRVAEGRVEALVGVA